MASLVPVPEIILEQLRRRHDRYPCQLHLAIHDSVLDDYEVMSDTEWRNLQRCDGFELDRYSVVASTILDYSRP